MPTFMEKPIIFSDHALERGLQVGMTEEQLYSCFALAERIKYPELEHLSKHFNSVGMRYYRSGGNLFIVRNFKQKMLVITIWDDVFVRNEGYKLKKKNNTTPSVAV